jgi:hypothetical protein
MSKKDSKERTSTYAMNVRIANTGKPKARKADIENLRPRHGSVPYNPDLYEEELSVEEGQSGDESSEEEQNSSENEGNEKEDEAKAAPSRNQPVGKTVPISSSSSSSSTASNVQYYYAPQPTLPSSNISAYSVIPGYQPLPQAMAQATSPSTHFGVSPIVYYPMFAAPSYPMLLQPMFPPVPFGDQPWGCLSYPASNTFCPAHNLPFTTSTISASSSSSSQLTTQPQPYLPLSSPRNEKSEDKEKESMSLSNGEYDESEQRSAHQPVKNNTHVKPNAEKNKPLKERIHRSRTKVDVSSFWYHEKGLSSPRSSLAQARESSHNPPPETVARFRKDENEFNNNIPKKTKTAKGHLTDALEKAEDKDFPQLVKFHFVKCIPRKNNDLGLTIFALTLKHLGLPSAKEILNSLTAEQGEYLIDLIPSDSGIPKEDMQAIDNYLKELYPQTGIKKELDASPKPGSTTSGQKGKKKGKRKREEDGAEEAKQSASSSTDAAIPTQPNEPDRFAWFGLFRMKAEASSSSQNTNKKPKTSRVSGNPLGFLAPPRTAARDRLAAKVDNAFDKAVGPKKDLNDLKNMVSNPILPSSQADAIRTNLPRLTSDQLAILHETLPEDSCLQETMTSLLEQRPSTEIPLQSSIFSGDKPSW